MSDADGWPPWSIAMLLFGFALGFGLGLTLHSFFHQAWVWTIPFGALMGVSLCAFALWFKGAEKRKG